MRQMGRRQKRKRLLGGVVAAVEPEAIWHLRQNELRPVETRGRAVVGEVR